MASTATNTAPPASESLPPPDTMQKAASYEVVDEHGEKHTIASLCSAKSRTMIMLVRHVFCGSCQAYIKSLTAEIPTKDLDAADTSIIIIGCSDHTLIGTYMELTGSPYPVYMDHAEGLYGLFDTAKGRSFGSSPYINDSLPKHMFKSFTQVSGAILRGVLPVSQTVARAGNPDALGGEFLCEFSPKEGADKTLTMTWCHRMTHTMDHASAADVKKVLKL